MLIAQQLHNSILVTDKYLFGAVSDDTLELTIPNTLEVHKTPTTLEVYNIPRDIFEGTIPTILEACNIPIILEVCNISGNILEVYMQYSNHSHR